MRSDGSRFWSLRAAVAVAVLGLWLVWFVSADVKVFETSEAARIESAQSVHSLEAPVSGRLDSVRAVLGTSVREGDVLFEFDAEEEQFELLEAESRLASLRSQLGLLLEELVLESEGLDARRTSDEEEAQAAKSRAKVEEVDARYSLEELDQLTPLRDAGLISSRELLQLRAEAERAATRAEAEQRTFSSLEREHTAEDKKTLATLTRLRREAAETEGAIQDLEAHIEHLRHQVEERSMGAPIGGRVGWLTSQQPGSFVAAGQRLADIVPDGELRLVAYFPTRSLGRVRPGQRALVRLHAYPWTQFGTLRATVDRVASEPEEGRLRTELLLADTPSSAIVLEHGLSADVEVEVEALSPARLALRAAGDASRFRDDA